MGSRISYMFLLFWRGKVVNRLPSGPAEVTVAAISLPGDLSSLPEQLSSSAGLPSIAGAQWMKEGRI